VRHRSLPTWSMRGWWSRLLPCVQYVDCVALTCDIFTISQHVFDSGMLRATVMAHFMHELCEVWLPGWFLSFDLAGVGLLWITCDKDRAGLHKIWTFAIFHYWLYILALIGAMGLLHGGYWSAFCIFLLFRCYECVQCISFFFVSVAYSICAAFWRNKWIITIIIIIRPDRYK